MTTLFLFIFLQKIPLLRHNISISFTKNSLYNFKSLLFLLYRLLLTSLIAFHTENTPCAKLLWQGKKRIFKKNEEGKKGEDNVG